MNRIYTNYDENESYTGGWMNASYGGNTGYADHVHRPVIVDSEGRKHPIIRYTPPHNSEAYVVKAETVVEQQVARTPVVSFVMTDYRPYGFDPEKEEAFKEYGIERRFTQLGSTNQRPMGKIQTEVSQPTKFPGPFISNWRVVRPVSTGQDGNTTKYGDDKDFMIKGGNQKKIYNVPVGDKQIGSGYTFIPQGTNPVIPTNKHNFYERPNDGPIVPSHPLSRPVNDVNDAIEILSEGIKTMQSEANRATKAGNLGGMRWINGPKVDSDGGDSEMVKEQKNYGMENRQKYYQESLSPISNKDYDKAEGNEAPSKGFGQFTSFPAMPRFTVPPPQPKEVNSYDYGDTIDSTEARKRYGKLKPQPVSESAYKGAINSEDLIKKYNGAKLSW